MPYTTINKSTDYFNTVTYQGDGTTQNEITGVGFQPDFTWVKNRDQASTPNLVVDIIRGYGTSGKTLTTNETSAEASNSTTSRFVDNGAIADGFTVGNSSYTNGSGTNYASWNWLGANGTASNTDGTITSTVSANTTAGFSIVSYTGTGSNATVGHGLGVVPKMIIVKDRTTTRDWFVYHNSIGNANRLKLNDTAASGSSTVWNSTTPTSSVFSIDSQVYTNASGNNFIAYCFAEKTGYSKFGSYEGNGSTDGTFVYTGFKPAFVIRKNADASTDWRIDDNKRPGYNVIPYTLFPNLNNNETTSSGYYVDLLSNGFKVRGTSVNQNTSGQTYIYMAFGQSLVGSNNVPCTAR